jgi:hypothetical protein
MELCFISSYSGGFDVRSWFKYKFILCFYSPVGVYFQREAWCYWCLLFTTLYASRRRGNLIYFSTNRVSLNQTETNQVKGKFYIYTKIKYINRIPCRCVGVEQCDRWAGDVSFYTLSPNWVLASPTPGSVLCTRWPRSAVVILRWQNSSVDAQSRKRNAFYHQHLPRLSKPATFYDKNAQI